MSWSIVGPRWFMVTTTTALLVVAMSLGWSSSSFATAFVLTPPPPTQQRGMTGQTDAAIAGRHHPRPPSNQPRISNILPTVTTTTTTTQLHGIPKMFRWLTDQYPNINRRLSEGLTSDLKVDNFYLDMNGIIHPCTHGNAEGQIIVLDETAMFKKIFLYVDRYV